MTERMFSAPWEAKHEDHTERGCCVSDADGMVVARRLTEERAHLIAAAPELYEALVLAIKLVRAHVPADALGVGDNGMEGPYYREHSHLDEALHYMDAALAKATPQAD